MSVPTISDAASDHGAGGDERAPHEHLDCPWRIRSCSVSVLSLDVEVDVRRLAASVDRDGEVIRGPQARVCLERLLGARHVEAVDLLQTVAVLHTERAEERVGTDAEEANAHDLAVLLLGDDARLAHQLGLVLEDLVDDAAVDVELGRPDLLDALLDVVAHGAAPPATGAGAGGAGGALATGGAGGLNICAWQSWLPLVIQTRSQPMNFTVLPPTSPPRRRRKLFPFCLGVSRAAKDQSGSGDAAMMRMCTPSQIGAL